MNNPVYHIALLGDACTGKTCIARYLTNQAFDSDGKMTMGAEIYFVPSNKGLVRLIDTAGSERFQFMLDSYPMLKILNGAILCADYRTQPIQNLNYHLNMAKQWNNDKLPVVVFATKNDVNQENTDFFGYKIKEFTKENKLINPISVSAKTGFNIKEGLNSLLELIDKSRFN